MDYYVPGAENAPTEYEILLDKRDPSFRITGWLDSKVKPETVRFEYKDWFTMWTTLPLTPDDEQTMLEFITRFYFGV
jgi:hypothetical protein